MRQRSHPACPHAFVTFLHAVHVFHINKTPSCVSTVWYMAKILSTASLLDKFDKILKAALLGSE